MKALPFSRVLVVMGSCRSFGSRFHSRWIPWDDYKSLHDSLPIYRDAFHNRGPFYSYGFQNNSQGVKGSRSADGN
jgi:hypothetical protein